MRIVRMRPAVADLREMLRRPLREFSGRVPVFVAVTGGLLAAALVPMATGAPVPVGLSVPSLTPTTVLGVAAPTSLTFPCWATLRRTWARAPARLGPVADP